MHNSNGIPTPASPGLHSLPSQLLFQQIQSSLSSDLSSLFICFYFSFVGSRRKGPTGSWRLPWRNSGLQMGAAGIPAGPAVPGVAVELLPQPLGRGVCFPLPRNFNRLGFAARAGDEGGKAEKMQILIPSPQEEFLHGKGREVPREVWSARPWRWHW